MKEHIRFLLRSIRKAFEISDSLEEYEQLCMDIYFSCSQVGYDTFLKLKKLVF